MSKELRVTRWHPDRDERDCAECHRRGITNRYRGGMGARERKCGRKKAYLSFSEAVGVLEATRNGREERLRPYRCKVCGNWHNGHNVLELWLEYEPSCGCGHLAAHHAHQTAEYVGCQECSCLKSGATVYRSAIRFYRREAKVKSKLFVAVVALYPKAMRRWATAKAARALRRALRARFGRGHPSTSSG